LTKSDDVPKFLKAVMDSGNDENYDLKFVKSILSQINYRRPLILFMFIAYVVYMALLLYYFSFVITEKNEDAKGFAKGKPFNIAIRFIILFLTFYFVSLESVQAFHMKLNYFCFRRL
jgi:hypothetical protein